LLLALLAVGCAVNPYAATNRSYKKQARALSKQLRPLPAAPDSLPAPAYPVGTTNFNLRKPNYVIIHHTAQTSTAQTLKTFTLPRTQVSAHYVIGRDGQTVHMLNDYLRAWHGGVARWGSLSDINSVSIGIELDNDGTEPFQEAQISSLLRLLGQLKKAYQVPVTNFIGHADIAPTRKNDPSTRFPWARLAARGYGLWYDAAALAADPTAPVPFAPADSLGRPGPGLSPAEALRIIGYDTRNLPDAIVAFKRHFVQTDLSPGLTEWDRRVLYAIYRQCL